MKKMNLFVLSAFAICTAHFDSAFAKQQMKSVVISKGLAITTNFSAYDYSEHNGNIENLDANDTKTLTAKNTETTCYLSVWSSRHSLKKLFTLTSTTTEDRGGLTRFEENWILNNNLQLEVINITSKINKSGVNCEYQQDDPDMSPTLIRCDTAYAAARYVDLKDADGNSWSLNCVAGESIQGQPLKSLDDSFLGASGIFISK